MSETTTPGRKVFERIKVVQDLCPHTYGVGPCTADITKGKKKCFNTRAGCQDPENYEVGGLVLPFCKNQIDTPKDEFNIPMLVSARTSSATINPGGGNKNASALGVRGTLSATFKDAPYPDTLVDKYADERPYDPLTRGTFWSKWRARNKYYLNRPIIHESGYILPDGTIEAESLITKTFFITGFTGPDANGSVTLSGKDAFSLAADTKAKAPFVSVGKLSADITAGDTSAVLTPASVGDTYPATGKVRIGSEVLSYTRTNDTLAFGATGRAENNTVASEHKLGSGVQICLEYDAQSPSEILYDLLLNYAKIDPAYLDKAAWDAEVVDFLPRLYSSIITEPTGVTTLIGEISEQMSFYTWWDERDSKVKMRAVRPSNNEQVWPLDDMQHLVADSVAFSDQNEQLVTQVWVYYGQLNPTEKLDERRNYGAVEVVGDGDAEGRAKHDKSYIKEVFSRWIISTGGGTAISLGLKTLARYGEIPVAARFKLDAKDNDIRLGDFVTVNNRLIVDDEGNNKPVNLQILSEAEVEAGTSYAYMAQQFVFEDDNTSGEKTIIIAADILNLNLLDTYNDQFGVPPVEGDIINFIIRSGVEVGGRYNPSGDYWPTFAGNRIRVNSSDNYYLQAAELAPVTYKNVDTPIYLETSLSGNTPDGDEYSPTSGATGSDLHILPCATSLITGDWPTGVILNLTIEAGALVSGHGGNGAANYGYTGTGFDGYVPMEASDGGYGMEITHPISINNLGIISGGMKGGETYYEDFFQVGNFRGRSPTLYATGAGGNGVPAGYASAPFINETNANGTLGQVVTGSSRVDASASAGSPHESFFINGEYFGRSFAQPSTVSYEVNLFGRRRLFISSLSPDADTLHAIKSGASLITWENKGTVVGTETP